MKSKIIKFNWLYVAMAISEKKLFPFFPLVFILCMLGSCEKEMPRLEGQHLDSPTEIDYDLRGMVVLGKQKQNPYSVVNMERARENLKLAHPNEATAFDRINIRTTHRYIRFAPKDWEEHGVLSREKDLVLSTFPLDYEIKEQGHQYHDPSIPLGQPTYQYCAVEFGKTLPDVDYEVLADLYIPEEDPELNDLGLNTEEANEHMEALVLEALKITDNLEEEFNGRWWPKWRPAGTIQIWDDEFQTLIPLEGIEVRATRWFRTERGTTDSLGRYSCGGRFRGPALYTIRWHAEDFSIRSGIVGAAMKFGPSKRGDWNYDCQGGLQEFYGTIFRASYHYYYQDIKDLKRPPLNLQGRPKLKIAAHNGSWVNNGMFNPVGAGTIFNWIHIWNENNTGPRSSYGNYSLTIHELAHASHWELNHQAFSQLSADIVLAELCLGGADAIGSQRLVESWANGIQYELTRQIYPSYQGAGSIINTNSTPCDPYVYTGLVLDIIDSQGAPNRGTDLPIDLVEGYTIGQIEASITGVTSWEGWRDAIKSDYSNPTEANLDSLFSYWASF